MIGAHLATTGGHHHGANPAALPAAPTLDMGMAMGLATAVAAVEILFAAAVLFVRTRAPR
jgi:hypothetical protein